jgi:hypothetical protein
MSAMDDFLARIGFVPDTDEVNDTPGLEAGVIEVSSASLAFEAQESAALLMLAGGTRLPAFLSKLSIPLRARALTYIDQVILDRTKHPINSKLFEYLLISPEAVSDVLKTSQDSQRFFLMAGALATVEVSMWDEARLKRVTAAVASMAAL